MSVATNPEVLVVGAGPVGLFSALALSKHGIRVRIVDKDWRTGAHSYALALHARCMGLLEDFDLRDEVLAWSYPVRTVGLYDRSERRAELRLSGDDDATSLMVMRQDVLEHLLEETLVERGVAVQWNHEVSCLDFLEDGVVATIDKLVKEPVGYAVARTEWTVADSTELKVPFVIGADGHRSFVRHAIETDYDAAGPPTNFAVFECTTDADLKHEMRVVFGDETTDVLWPMPDGRCRFGFQVTDLAAPASSRMKDRLAVQIGGHRYEELSEESLQRMIAERMPWFEGKIEEIHWRILVRFEERLADSFGTGRTWLAGDAAHTTGPVGMQSMNIGFAEADHLAELLAGILRENTSLDQLRTYNTRWLAEWRGLLGIHEQLKLGEKTDPWIREQRYRLLPCLPAWGSDLAELAQQLALEASWCPPAKAP